MNGPRKKITAALRPILSAGLAVLAGAALSAPVAENPVFPRPTIVPVPAAVAGVTQAVPVARGNWKTIANPQGEFWSESADLSTWRDMSAGGRRGGGFGGGRGGGGSQPAYRTQLAIPADYAGHRVVLRFDGVSNGAKVWVNGRFVRDHWGSFMPFTCDITDLVEPGKTASLTVGVDDSRTGLAQYVRAGGLQRDVKLLAEPLDYLTRFHIDTDLDAQYRDAILKVWLRMEFHGGDNCQVKLRLKDAPGRLVDLKPAVINLSRATPEQVTGVAVTAPLKWDAEHPNLYTLEVTVLGPDGGATQTLSRKFGFIKTERVGRRVLVNGREIKLRGVWGGNSVQDLAAANVNHTRQKWVTEDFLEQCDQLGVYVTDENPVDFSRNPVADDPQFLPQYLGLMADLVERDRDHPSVIMWGLDNESDYGQNVGPTFRYVHAEDPRRTAMFSWSHRVPDDQELPYDVFSFHYPPFNGDLGSYGNSAFNDPSLVLHRRPQPQIPVLADEYAHLPGEQWHDWRPPVTRGSQILWSDTPTGPYHAFTNHATTPTNMMTLDGTFWVEDGVPYMVFCNEWVQISDGTVEYIPLKDDLSEAMGAPTRMFRGSSAKWSELIEAGGHVTDGPYVWKGKTGKLYVIWSSRAHDQTYELGVAISDSGKLAGPWRQEDAPLYASNGGHGMIFNSFDGRLMLVLHAPDGCGPQPHLFEIEDAGETLRIVKEFTGAEPGTSQ